MAYRYIFQFKSGFYSTKATNTKAFPLLSHRKKFAVFRLKYSLKKSCNTINVTQNYVQVQTRGFHYFPCHYLFHLTKEKQKLNYNMFAQVTNG